MANISTAYCTTVYHINYRVTNHIIAHFSCLYCSNLTKSIRKLLTVCHTKVIVLAYLVIAHSAFCVCYYQNRIICSFFYSCHNLIKVFCAGVYPYSTKTVVTNQVKYIFVIFLCTVFTRNKSAHNHTELLFQR